MKLWIVTNGQIRTALICAALGLAPVSAAANDLAKFFALAKQNDATYQEAQATWQTTQESRAQAKSGLLPQVQLGASVTKNWSNSDSAFATGDVRRTSADLSVSQPLYRRDRLLQLEQTDSVLAKADTDLKTATQDLIVRVVTRYFDVLSASDDLEFARADKRATENHLEQTRKRYEVGLIAITEVQEGQARHDLIAASELASANALTSKLEALREISGEFQEHVAPLASDIKLAPPEPADPEYWAKQAQQQNLSIRSLQLAATSAQTDIDIARAARMPTVDLIGQISRDDLHPDKRDQSDTTEQIGIQLSVPLYTGGLNSSKIRQAGSEYNRALAGARGVQSAVAKQTRDAFRGVATSIRQVRAYEQAVTSNQSALQATKAGFDVGTRTIVDVIDAERELHSAQRDLARSKYQYLLSWIQLKAAVGTLQENDLLGIDKQLKL